MIDLEILEKMAKDPDDFVPSEDVLILISKIRLLREQNAVMRAALARIGENDADYAPSFKIARDALTKCKEMDKNVRS